ncbi:MAG: hypothetical protein JNM84_16035 [Planctomycetes bacterium]|nr:hypothetical protein [Planctomycetota bacterium]
MQAILTLGLGLGLCFSGSAFAQEQVCPASKAQVVKTTGTQECTGQKSECSGQEERLTSARVQKLIEGCDKGCEASKAQLTALKKAAGTECSQELLTKVQGLEKGCAGGCETSKATLTKLSSAVQEPKADKKVVVAGKPIEVKTSERVAKLVENCDKGCEASKTQLTALKKVAGTECNKELVTKIQGWEKGCEGGCETSKAQLTAIKTALGDEKKVEKKTEASLSETTAQLVKWSEGGCATSTATLTAMKKAAGTECCNDLVTKIQAWEKGCAGGCETSKAQLTAVKKAMTDAAPAKKVEKKTDASMSDTVAQLVKYSEGGCAASTAKLAALKKECGTECCEELVTKVKALEGNCAKGCDASKAKLESLRTKL